MGAEGSKVPDEYLDTFEKQTFFTRSEINNLYDRFVKMGGNIDTRVPTLTIIEIPELAVNPMRKRICHVFGSESRNSGMGSSMTFSEFLNMMNAFSSRASIEIKAFWAFKIYDFNEDNFIDVNDVVKLLEFIVGKNNLTPEQALKIAHRVMDEADLDGNNKLSRTEFMRLLFRVPDFSSRFQFNTV